MIVEASGLRFSYPARPGALDHISFQIPSGSLCAVIGPNGSGKSTLFRILATLWPPEAGRLRMGAFEVGQGAAEIRRRMGIVFQSHTADRRLTVQENLACRGALQGLTAAEVERRGAALLEQFGLADRRNDLAGALSGGLLRRLDLAAALLAQPELLLLDEASAGLDAVARRDFWNLVEAFRRQHAATVIFTTHLREEIEPAGQVIYLRAGKVAAVEPPEALLARAGHPVLNVTGEGLDGIMQARGGQPAGEGWRLRHPEPAAALLEISRIPGVSLSHAEIARPSLEDLFEAVGDG